MTQPTPDRIVRPTEVSKQLGISLPTLYRWVTLDKFPKPFKLVKGGHASGWMRSTIEQYITQRQQGGL